MGWKTGLTALLFAGAAAIVTMDAQTLQVFSEFERLDPYGNILPVDRALRPREILSPAVARNAYASFQIAVTAPPNTNYFLYVVTNPGDLFRIALYKEQFVPAGDQWIPDTLELARLPCFGVMPDAEIGVADQTTRLYLLDVWVPRETLVRRVRLEVLLKTGGWIVAPMEVRVVAATVPDLPEIAYTGAPHPPVEARSDTAAWGPIADYLANYLAGVTETRALDPLTLQSVIRRNAAQDMALAKSIETARYPRAASLDILLRTGKEIFAGWSKNPIFPDELGSEWYLKIRDLLFRSVP
ncbi:MAG: hypothetical protein M3Z85_11520 [Acidobacteriota bacterium]|nr:hypothetical protein [Acidobacteriota bacterium]